MKVLNSLILTSVLALWPVALWADASLPIQDIMQCQGSDMTLTEQPLSEANEDMVPPGFIFHGAELKFFSQLPELSDMYAQDKVQSLVLAQNKEVEGEKTEETVSDETNIVEEAASIPDPFAPMNKAMFHINDKLYFWVLKPITQAYSLIIPEDIRILFNNFYDNLKSPARIVNNMLQLRLKAAGNELIRFVFNSVAGFGGLADVSREALGIKKQEADFGQTLGHYGIDHGFYIIWPLLGPSSLRDTAGLVGDRLMYPLTYIDQSDLSTEAVVAIFAHEKVNDTSFKIGDYESFKDSAIDPYISMRDAFVQHRKKKVEESKQ